MTYVVFDFETTGLSAEKNEIIQIGALKYTDEHEKIAEYNQLIKPQRSYISNFISELTGIYSRDVLDKPYIQDVLPDFLEFLSGSLLIGHNIGFDMSFLFQAIVDSNIKNSPDLSNTYDTAKEARRLLKARSYKLESLKEMLGIDVRSHDALNDCIVTAALYQHLWKIEHPEPKAVEADQFDLFVDYELEGITADLRRKLGLPITKDLVYYQLDLEKNWQKLDLTAIKINQDYSAGFSLCITLYNGDKVNIHSDFLKEMQKANFISEIEGI